MRAYRIWPTCSEIFSFTYTTYFCTLYLLHATIFSADSAPAASFSFGAPAVAAAPPATSGAFGTSSVGGFGGFGGGKS